MGKLNPGDVIPFAYVDGTPMRVGDVVSFSDPDVYSRFGIIGDAQLFPDTVGVQDSPFGGCQQRPEKLTLQMPYFTPTPREIGDPARLVALTAELQALGPRVSVRRTVVFEGTPEAVAHQIVVSAPPGTLAANKTLRVTLVEHPPVPLPES